MDKVNPAKVETERKIGMTIHKAWIGLTSVLWMSSTLLTGCMEKQPVLSVEKPPQAVTEPALPTPTPSASTLPVTKEPEATAEQPHDKVTLASTETPPKTEQGVTGEASKPSKPKIDISEPYTQAKPTLLGLTLKTSSATVEEKFGKPKEQFVMDEEADPITVYDYKDFLIGFSTEKKVEFIDVRSKELDPGLGGLRLGGTVSEVQEALGKPHSTTGLVITYKASGAILKLDLDPKTQTVNSIKLFAE